VKLNFDAAIEVAQTGVAWLARKKRGGQQQQQEAFHRELPVQGYRTASQNLSDPDPWRAEDP
jgi:hypothetical protein